MTNATVKTIIIPNGMTCNYGMTNISIEMTDNGTFVVLADTERFGKHEIMFESYNFDECEAWAYDSMHKEPKSKKLSTTRKTIVWADLMAGLDTLELKASAGNSKMGKILSFNITAGGEPYVRSDGLELSDFKGSCDGVCEGCQQGCYARNSEMRFKTVQLRNAVNYALAVGNPAEYKRQVCQILDRVKDGVPVRIHECGEFFSLEYMSMWLDIIEMYPAKTFYTYTKHFDFVRVLKARILSLTNLRMNLSGYRENLDALKAEFPEFAIFLWDDSNIVGDNFGLEIPHDLRCPAVNIHGKMNHGVKCVNCGKCFKAQYAGKVIACYDHSKSEKHA